MLAHCPPRRVRVRQRVGALLGESPRQPLLVALLRHAAELARARLCQVLWGSGQDRGNPVGSQQPQRLSEVSLETRAGFVTMCVAKFDDCDLQAIGLVLTYGGMHI